VLVLWSDPLGILGRFSSVTSASQKENSLLSRYVIWHAAVGLIPSSPWIGHGVGSFAILLGSVSARINKAHNDYLRFLVETGLLGLVSFLVMMVHVLRAGLRLYTTGPDPERRGLGACLVASTTALLVMALTDNVFVSPFLQWYFWGFVGIVQLYQKDVTMQDSGQRARLQMGSGRVATA
jgi:O-antigen ligase